MTLPPTDACSRTLKLVDACWGRRPEGPRRGELARIVHASRRPGPETDAVALLAELYTAALFEEPSSGVLVIRSVLDHLSPWLLTDPPGMARRLAVLLQRLPPLLDRERTETALLATMLGLAGVSGPFDPQPVGRRFVHLQPPDPPAVVPRDRLEAEMLLAIREAPEGARAAGLRLLATGGKRVRARFLLGLAGPVPSDDAWGLAARVEWFHQISIALDDIVDAARERRDTPCLHRILDAPTVVAMAVDLLRCLLADLPAEVRSEALVDLFDLARGEALESLRPAHDPASHASVNRAKTASLFRLAGGLGVGANGGSAAAGRVLGEAVGMAFQLVDDVLDLTSSPAETGKDALQDVSNDRWTLPLDLLRRRLPAGVDLPTTPDPAWFATWMRRTGTDVHCRGLAHDHIRDALAATGLVPTEATASLLTSIVERRR